MYVQRKKNEKKKNHHCLLKSKSSEIVSSDLVWFRKGEEDCKRRTNWWRPHPTHFSLTMHLLFLFCFVLPCNMIFGLFTNTYDVFDETKLINESLYRCACACYMDFSFSEGSALTKREEKEKRKNVKDRKMDTYIHILIWQIVQMAVWFPL